MIKTYLQELLKKREGFYNGGGCLEEAIEYSLNRC